MVNITIGKVDKSKNMLIKISKVLLSWKDLFFVDLKIAETSISSFNKYSDGIFSSFAAHHSVFVSIGILYLFISIKD